MDRSSRSIRLILVLCAVLMAAAPAEAGFLDGIMAKVKGLFGGGKTKSDAALAKYLDRVEASQKAVFDLEKQIIEMYNGNAQGVAATDPQAQQLLNQLADASRTNEDSYLQLLKARGEAQKAGAKLDKFKERLDAIQENQRRLEEGYQKIQDYNRESGFYEPPPAAGGAGVASAGTSDPLSMDQFLNDPKVQGFIDEWLGMNGLDKFGRQIGVVKGGVIRANYNPDTDNRTRHRYVWEHLWQKSGGGRMTLQQYVMSRLDGGAAAPPATQIPPPATQNPPATDPGGYTPYLGGSTTPPGASTGEGLMERGRIPTSPSSGADLASVNKTHKELLRQLQGLNASGQGESNQAKQLLEQIRQLEARKNALLAQQSGS